MRKPKGIERKLTKKEKAELVLMLVDDLEDLTLAGATESSLNRIDRMIAKLK